MADGLGQRSSAHVAAGVGPLVDGSGQHGADQPQDALPVRKMPDVGAPADLLVESLLDRSTTDEVELCPTARDPPESGSIAAGCLGQAPPEV